MGWRRFVRRAYWDRERGKELDSYLQIETDENIARGMSPQAARRAAHRKLGNTVRIREEIYEMNTIDMLESLGRDLRYAVRGMTRRPGFTLAVVLTLALGIGANAAIFSVVNGVLLKPLAYPDADGLVSIHHVAPGITTAASGPVVAAGGGVGGTPAGEVTVSPSMYFTYQDESRVFQHIGIWGHGGRTLTGHGDPEQVRALFVTFDVLPALGVQPMLGRRFSRADDAWNPAVADPIILTYSYWQRRFGGDRSVVGRRLLIDAQAAEIVGVMPQGFRFLDLKPEIEVINIVRFNRARTTLAEFGSLQGLARLKPGLTLADANADVARMLPIWFNAWPVPPGALGKAAIANWHIAPALRPLKDDVVGNVSQLAVAGNVPDMLWVVMGTLGLVLLIACANIANLMLVRSDGRRQEFAVRAALGAGRRRIAREVLVESLALGALGGALGMLVAYGALKLLVVIAPAALPRLNEISLDARVFVFAAVVSLLCSLICGFLPALRQASQADAPMAAGTRGASVSRERQRTRNTLVVVQVALALVLLVSSGLMLRTFQALQNVDPGFTRAEELQTMRLWIPPSRIREPEQFVRTQQEILERIGAIPGVTAAGFASAIPMEGRVNDDRVIVEGESYAASETPPRRRHKFVSPGFFRAMGTRMIAGRDITWADIYTRTPVAVISENFASEIWGTPAEAIGKRIREPSPADRPQVWREVVGVVQDVHEDGLYTPAPATVYWPTMMDNFFGAEFANRAAAFVIRSDRAGSEGLMNDVRQAVWSVNGDLPVFLVRTLDDLYDESLATTSFAMVMLAIAAMMALGLGVIGTYGVISYVVSQRSREIGLRLALGAEPTKLERMFVLQGLALAGIGAVAGLAAALGLTRWMSSLLFGIGPWDPMTYGVVLGILLTATALASYMPARRAASVNPMLTLNAE